MTRTRFAGYIEIPEWVVSVRKGHHEGLISFETHELNQNALRTGPGRQHVRILMPTSRHGALSAVMTATRL